MPVDPSYVHKLAERALRAAGTPAGQPIRLLLEQTLVVFPSTAETLAQELDSRADLQAKLSNLTGYTPSSWLLDGELDDVNARRQLFGIDGVSPPPGEPMARAFESGLMGLCCSGGGIRSATFSLGILQALAELDLLRPFDYLSSVSGGGYIHQWLAAWLRRESDPAMRGATSTQAFEYVNRQLVPPPDPFRNDPQPEPLRWLRRYSNYLTPKRGLFSGDTWAAVTIWLRNTLLNQTILISGLFFLLMLPHLLAPPALGVQGVLAPDPAMRLAAIKVAFVVLLALMGVPTFLAARSLFAFAPSPATPHLLDEHGVQFSVVLPLLLWALLWTVLPDAVWTLPLAGALFMLLGLAVAFGGGALEAYVIIHTKNGAKPPLWRKAFAVIGFVVIVGLAASAGAAWVAVMHYMLADLLPSRFPTLDAWRLSLVLGPALYLMAPMLTLLVLIGLVGRPYHEPRREWLSRFAAWVALYALGWVVMFGVSLFGHALVDWLLVAERKVNPWTAIPSIAAWLGLSTGGILAAKSTTTSGGTSSESDPKGAGITEWLSTVGPYVFILGLFLMLAWFADEAAMRAWNAGLLAVAALIATPALVCALFGWRVDINEFSMHAFYRNRLARCYLGASNLNRRPNPFTAFDDEDAKIKVSQLRAVDGYPGPFPIFCTALNLTVGEDLAWQERRAASFAFTPLYSGYYADWTESKGKRGDLRFNSFVETSKYAYPGGGIAVSTAASISGAAVSPNWGYHTDPATAFVLTMFNARLGWWLRNPRGLETDGTRRLSTTANDRPWPSPHFAVWHLVKELLGQIDDTAQYVYLSDGGHFDNMGLYELVRRGCRYIVICDGEQDGELGFGGIAMAIRKCHADFGVKIDLDLRALERRKDAVFSGRHVVVGTIRYPGVCKDRPDLAAEAGGIIVYIKSSLTGDEPADILSYKKEHPAFPHDSTTNQWFTESQFESYRALGHHVGLSVFAPARPDTFNCDRLDEREGFFQSLKDIWYPPTPEMERHRARHAERFDELLRQARTEARLSGLLERLFNPGDGLWAHGRPPEDAEYARGFTSEMLEFMWTVYVDLNLVQPVNLAHPHSRGWVEIFSKWSQVDAVRDGWRVYGESYSAEFRLFAESHLNLPLEEPA